MINSWANDLPMEKLLPCLLFIQPAGIQMSYKCNITSQRGKWIIILVSRIKSGVAVADYVDLTCYGAGIELRYLTAMINLRIPDQIEPHFNRADEDLGKLKEWINELPLANPQNAATKIITTLHQFNRTRISAAKRLQVMSSFSPVVSPIITTLNKSYVRSSWPYSNKDMERMATLQKLLIEMAAGYKIIIRELIESDEIHESIGTLLAIPLYQATIYLGQQLLLAYMTYTREPAHVWQELHQLYLYMENSGLLGTLVENEAGINEPIENDYMRTVLLALANPYHLMPGDAAYTYEQLKKWAHHGKFNKLDKTGLKGGMLYVDLPVDMPPRYQSLNKNIVQPVNGRLIDTRDLLEVINVNIQAIENRGTENNPRQSNLDKRIQKATLQRLAQSYGVRPERLSSRKTALSPVIMAVGLSTSHYMVSEGLEFNPEESEVQLRKQGLHKNKDQPLALDGKNQAPHIAMGHVSPLERGVNHPDTSRFVSDNIDDKDLRVRIPATPAHNIKTGTEGKLTEIQYQTVEGTQKNASQGGLSMLYKDTQVRISVGELIAYKHPSDPDNPDWHIGSVRWLRVGPDQGLEFGLGLIANDACAVATKAIKGVGMGGQYFRGLIIPNMDPLAYPTTLITPSSIYDINTVLYVNMSYQLICIQLTQMIETTNSFSMYRFKLINEPVAPIDEGEISSII